MGEHKLIPEGQSAEGLEKDLVKDGYLKVEKQNDFVIRDPQNFHDLSDKDMDGNVVPMEKYKGRVVLVVNVASK